MNNEEYMEYEGYKLIEAALFSYTFSGTGYELTSGLSAARVLPSAGSDAFLMDYVLFRLYLAEKTIRHFPSGFGCMDRVAAGLQDGLHNLPLALRTFSLLRNLDGSFLLLGGGEIQADKAFVEKRFAEFRRIEALSSGSLEKMISALASLSCFTPNASVITYFVEETKAFLSFLQKKLSLLTPCRISQGARKMTPALSLPGTEAVLDSSFLALLTGLALSCLVMLL